MAKVYFHARVTTLLLAVLLTFGCQTKEQDFPSNMLEAEKYCLENDKLKVHYYEGYHYALKEIEESLKNGSYERSDFQLTEVYFSMGLDPEKNAFEVGYCMAVNEFESLIYFKINSLKYRN